MVDLHAHSSASDGGLKPAQLVEKAAQLGLNALALTDHDTLAGLEEAAEAAGNREIELIPGVELEIQTETGADSPEETAADTAPAGPAPGTPVPGVTGEFHLLGLGVSRPTAEFRDTLAWLAGARDRRNLAILAKIREAGIEAEYEDIKALSGGGLTGRPHFGAFLISRRVVRNQEQAFKRWLGKGRPFYAPKEGLPFAKAARLIHESGGAAVLAHPLSLYLSWGRLPEFTGRLKDKGLDGLEAWHPTAAPRTCKRLEDLSRGLGLCVTAGSDYHGAVRPDRRLGFTAGGKMIENRFWEELRERLRG
jgi:predicted metal-dependent phosphoesterase TrpH